MRSEADGEQVEKTFGDAGRRGLDLAEDAVDVDAAVRRRVGREAPQCLLQLTLGARPVAVRSVVPGDRHVDETLEEVALGPGRLAPLVLERLVCVEPALRPHELETPLEAHAPSSDRARTMPMATILLVGVDLMVRSRLDVVLAGHRLVTSDSVDPPDIVICDIARVDADEVADAWPETPIVGFTNHTDTTGLQRAHTAGFDQVLVRSALAERARQVVDELVGIDA